MHHGDNAKYYINYYSIWILAFIDAVVGGGGLISTQLY